jgi:hypothetical protein
MLARTIPAKAPAIVVVICPCPIDSAILKIDVILKRVALTFIQFLAICNSIEYCHRVKRLVSEWFAKRRTNHHRL